MPRNERRPGDRRGRPRLQHRFSGPLLAAAATACALALAEGLARIVHPAPVAPAPVAPAPSPPARAVYGLATDPELVWELLPGSQATVERSGQALFLRINSRGMRGKETATPKPPNTYRILALGDSITFGSEVAEEDSLPERLDALVKGRARPGWTVEVLNGGLPGYNTHQELVWLREKGLSLDPDLVLLNFSLNDVWLTLMDGFSNITQPVTLSPELFANPARAVPAIEPLPVTSQEPNQPSPPPRPTLRSQLKDRFRLYDLAAIRWHQLLIELGLRPRPQPQPRFPGFSPPEHLPALNDDGSPKWQWLRSRFLAIRDLLAQRQTPLVIWLALSSHRDAGPEWEPMRRHFATFGATQDIPVFDVSPLVRAHPEPPSLFRPLGHFSPAGNQLVAEGLFVFLLERRLLP